MGEIRTHDPVALVIAAFSAWEQALDWARERLQQTYGPIALESPRFWFQETEYYEPTMGSPLVKQFVAFDNLIEPESLVAIKHRTNDLEAEYAVQGRHPVQRPLNLDPGYLSLGKFVLASTKDHSHRLYLGRGTYAEVTLRYEGGQFVPWSWTYPDYCREDYRAFFQQARDWYRRRLKGEE